MSVTVVSVIYGEGYEQWAGEWMDSLQAMVTKPDDVVLHRDTRREHERYPQARLLDDVIRYHVRTEWVWVLNIDDLALPGGLDGLDNVGADVWLAGYRRSSGREVIPRAMTNADFLASQMNPYPSMSPFRRKAYLEVDGYPVIGNEDWGLWRRMARHGGTWEASGRVHCIYREHSNQRTLVDVNDENREEHLREVLADTL